MSTGGIAQLDAAWGSPLIPAVTTTYLPGCYARFKGIGGCADELRLVIAALWLPVVKDSLLEMIEQAPALQLFDSGQESHVKRHLSNARTFLVESEVVMVGDLCKPGSSGCP